MVLWYLEIESKGAKMSVRPNIAIFAIFASLLTPNSINISRNKLEFHSNNNAYQ